MSVELKIDLVAISLVDSLDRRKSIGEQLNKLPIPSAIFDALTDAPAWIPYNPAMALAKKNRTLSKGEIGCFASHCSVMRDLVERGAPAYRIIVEDDVFLDPSFWWNDIPRLMQAGDIHFLKLYSCSHPRNKRIAAFKYRSLIRFKLPPYGTQAYVVSLEGARKFVNGVKEIERPIDDYLDSFWRTGMPVYGLYPSPVLELTSNTTISGRELPQTKGIVNYPYKLHKELEKYRRQIANLALARRDKDLARKLANLPA